MNRLPAFLTIALTLVAAGCGNSSKVDTHRASMSIKAPGATSVTANASSGSASDAMSSAGTAQQELRVQVGEMYIRPADTRLKAGTYKVSVTNNGTMMHEVVFLKTDVADGKLPATGGRVSEKTSVGEVGDVKNGTTKSETITLDKGTYQLVCNLPGHYQGGMHAILTVT